MRKIGAMETLDVLQAGKSAEVERVGDGIVGRGPVAKASERVRKVDGVDVLLRAVRAEWCYGLAVVRAIRTIESKIDRGQEAEFAWKIWTLDWDHVSPGEHTIVSRAIDTRGNIQPAMDDPRIAKKHTYWESNGQVTRRIRLS